MSNPVFNIHGGKRWFINGKLHRLDGPACEYANGSKEWWVGGKRHRLDGPACEWSSGSREWYVNGKRHREDGPAIEYSDGGKFWYVNGELHRLDGPAIEWDGGEEWWVNGKRHRLDGPACEWADGGEEWWVGGKEWWIEGKEYTEEEFNKLTKEKTMKTAKILRNDLNSKIKELKSKAMMEILKTSVGSNITVDKTDGLYSYSMKGEIKEVEGNILTMTFNNYSDALKGTITLDLSLIDLGGEAVSGDEIWGFHIELNKPL